MADFYFSFWPFDANFIPSVVILAVTCFVITFTVTRLFTSQTVADLITGQTPRQIAQRHQASLEDRMTQRQQALVLMRQEIDAITGGRKTSELDKDEREAVAAIRQYYLQQIKRLCE
jgi:hypothetical protein